MQEFVWKITETFRSPRPNPNVQGGIEYKTFDQGQEVIGIARPPSGGVPLAPAILTRDGWIIPLTNVQQGKQVTFNERDIRKINLSKVVSLDMASEKLQEKLNKIKDNSLSKELTESAKFSTNGLLIGAAIGFGFAAITGRSKLLFAGLGAVGGGIAGRYLGGRSTKSTKESIENILKQEK